LKLINKTERKVIATKVIVREKICEIVLGLIPYKTKNKYIYDYLKFKKFGKNDAMLFKVRGKSGIHTWFMSFSIGVFFIDKDGLVIEKVLMKPFEIHNPKKCFDYFIETDESKFRHINLGDKLEIS